MITVSPLPTWRQLFIFKNQKRDFVWNKEKVCFYLNKSSTSIELIVQALLEVKKAPISIWIPNYFCDDTLSGLYQLNNVDLYFYPITTKLDVNWKELKDAAKDNKPDVFIFVHYFGIEKDASRAKSFCMQNDCIMIEDCAHVMYPSGKIGQIGDFVLFSLYKSLPLPDGAVLMAQSNPENEKLLVHVKKIVDKLPYSKRITLWRFKRIVQKLTGLKKKIGYNVEIHYNTSDDKLKRNPSTMLQMSIWSRTAFQKHFSSKLTYYSYLRRWNLLTVNWLIKRECPDIIPLLMPEKVECPYLAVYSMEQIKDKKEAINCLKEKGYLLQWWPDLPPLLKEDEYAHMTAKDLSENIFTLPIHQTLSPQMLIKRYNKKATAINTNHEILIDWENFESHQWMDTYFQVSQSALSQSFIHGEIKRMAEGWTPIRGIIYVDGERAGTVQVLCRSILAFLKIYRISCGPMLLDQYQTKDITIRVIELLKQRFARPFSPLFILPNLLMDPEALADMTSLGFYHWKIKGFHSAGINLTISKDELRTQLKSKWRNQLKKAEKSPLEIEEGDAHKEKLIELFEEFEKENKFKGASSKLLKVLFEVPDSHITLKATLESKIVAFIIIYLHGNAATYYVGWSNEVGRSYYANNLLLFQAMMLLKEREYSYFDLGGYDEILTPDITHFKRGINGKEYQMLGEFIAL